jgi:chorismate mutase
MRDRLAALRAEIDDLDLELVELLNRRTRLGIEAGRAKAGAGLPVTDLARERDVLARVASANAGPLPTDEILALYTRLIETIKRLEVLETEDAAPAMNNGPGGSRGQAGDR